MIVHHKLIIINVDSRTMETRVIFASTTTKSLAKEKAKNSQNGGVLLEDVGSSESAST